MHVANVYSGTSPGYADTHQQIMQHAHTTAMWLVPALEHTDMFASKVQESHLKAKLQKSVHQASKAVLLHGGHAASSFAPANS